MPWEVGEYFCFLELTSELYKCGDCNWFCLEIGCALSNQLRPIHWYHSLADLIWSMGPYASPLTLTVATNINDTFDALSVYETDVQKQNYWTKTKYVQMVTYYVTVQNKLTNKVYTVDWLLLSQLSDPCPIHIYCTYSICYLKEYGKKPHELFTVFSSTFF